MRSLVFLLLIFGVMGVNQPVLANTISNLSIDSAFPGHSGPDGENFRDGGGFCVFNDVDSHSSAIGGDYYLETIYYHSGAEIVLDLNKIYEPDAVRVCNFNFVDEFDLYAGRGVGAAAISTLENSVDLSNFGRFEFPSLSVTPDYTEVLFTGLGR